VAFLPEFVRGGIAAQVPGVAFLPKFINNE
jgi:hypothetical protein